jgi:Na+/serine symporter
MLTKSRRNFEDQIGMLVLMSLVLICLVLFINYFIDELGVYWFQRRNSVINNFKRLSERDLIEFG